MAWGALDCLVVDMPPGTGDVQLTWRRSPPLAGAVIVSTPQDIALLDARRGIADVRAGQFRSSASSKTWLFAVPPSRGTGRYIRAGGARPEAERRGVAFLGEIPPRLAIRETADAGPPIVAAAPESAHALAYRAIGRAVIGKLDAPQRAAPKIVIG